jgi:ATP-dependent helicase/nuclease subunit A
MTDLADAKARSRIQAEYDTTFFVEAAAGTGKTTALVGRIVGLVRSGHGTLARTVAVTFPEKAAGEMKLRWPASAQPPRSPRGNSQTEPPGRSFPADRPSPKSPRVACPRQKS